MLKQGIVSAILLLIIVSFTVGTVSPISDTGGKGERGHFIVAYGAMPPMWAPEDIQFTRVMVDLSNEDTGAFGVRAWQAPPVPMIAGAFFGDKPGPGTAEFIEGRMTVIPAGKDVPQMFPVLFFRHHGPNETGRISYHADTNFNVDDSVLSFVGDIELKNDTLVTQDIATSVYDNEIQPGQTNWHQATVSGSPAAFNFELKWNNSADNLRVVVYTPDGKVLGPYEDNSDGSLDGTINMNITNPAGVADGTWSFKVTDTGVTGKDEYYLKTW